MGSSVYTSCTTWKICTHIRTYLYACKQITDLHLHTHSSMYVGVCMCGCDVWQAISKSAWNRWLKKQTGNVDDEIPSTNRMYVCMYALNEYSYLAA